MADSLTCAYCFSEFWVLPYRQNVARFCSRTCASRWQKMERPQKSHKVHKTCPHCGVVFFAWPHEAPTRRWCSMACRRDFYRNPENSHDMDRLREAAYDRDRGRCVDCGGRRYLETHHVNGQRRDNRLANLVTVCKKCHISRHVALTGVLPSGHVPRALR